MWYISACINILHLHAAQWGVAHGSPVSEPGERQERGRNYLIQQSPVDGGSARTALLRHDASPEVTPPGRRSSALLQPIKKVGHLPSKLCLDWNMIPYYFYQTRSLTIATSLICYVTISACSCGTDREKTGSGGQHWCLGHVDISTNLCFLQHHLLGLLQVAS